MPLMQFLHGDFALLDGTGSCYDPLLLLMKQILNATKLGKMARNVTRCDLMDYPNRLVATSRVPPCGFPRPGVLLDSVEARIMDFLAGRTHGEDLLHALYDHVLEEPVPGRMRTLFPK
jgi:hypothetical protein